MFEERMNRIFMATGADSDSSLARALDIQPPSIAGARKRELVPGVWIEKIALSYGVSADWLLFGRGPMRPNQPATEQPVPKAPKPSHAHDHDDQLRELTSRVQALEAENQRLTRKAEEALEAKANAYREAMAMLRDTLKGGMETTTVVPVSATPVPSTPQHIEDSPLAPLIGQNSAQKQTPGLLHC